MKLRLIPVFFLLWWGTVPVLGAWEWPFPVADAVVEGRFADDSAEGPRPGLRVRLPGGEAVTAVQAGEVLYHSRRSSSRRMGVWQSHSGLVVLDHGDGMRSLYRGLDLTGAVAGGPVMPEGRLAFLSGLDSPGQDAWKRPWVVPAGGVIGRSHEYLFLALMDGTGGTLVNPWTVLPVQRGRNPVFLTFRYRSEGPGEPATLYSGMEVSGSRVEILVRYLDGNVQGGGGAGSRMPGGDTVIATRIVREGNVLASRSREVLVADGPGHRELPGVGKVLSGGVEGMISMGTVDLRPGNNPLDLVLESAGGGRAVYRVWLRSRGPVAVP